MLPRILIITLSLIPIVCHSQGLLSDAEKGKREPRARFEAELSAVAPLGSTNVTIVGNIVKASRLGVEIAGTNTFNLPVSNQEMVKNLPEGLPLQFTVSRQAGSLHVDAVNLQVLSQWDQIKESLPQQEFPELHQAFQQLRNGVRTMQNNQETVDLEKDLKG